MVDNKYDIIIVGGGLGGLICANVLSKEGIKVCVLEKNPVIGGCLQSFKRKGLSVDTGIHYVGCLDEGQILNQYFKYFGILDQLKLRRLDADGYDVINIEGREYMHAIGHERFVETLSAQFPKERENIREVVKKIKEIGDLIHVDVLKKKHAFSLSGMPYFGLSASKYLEDHLSDPYLRSAIAGSVLLGGGEKETASLYVFAMITNSNIESSYRFVDGTQQVADLLVKRIREQGGDVRANSRVTRFIVENERIAGVEVNKEEILHADNYISAIHPSQTLALMDRCKMIKKAYISRIDSLQESLGFFSVSMIFKDQAIAYQNKNYYYYDENNVWTNSNYIRHKVKKMLFCHAAASLDKYCRVAYVLEPMFFHEVAKWANTTVEQRGDEYKAFKQQRAEQLLDYLEQRHPGLKNAIDTYYMSTPLTYRDYTASKNGSAYGIVKDFNNPLVTLLPVKTRIPNLYFTGQNNNVHGMIGVVLTAMYTCAEFVGMEYLAEKIGNV
jgi:phytoene dehydrogenase-like protein